MIPTLTDNQQRNLLFLKTPALWPQWPFLPLVRRTPESEPDLGLLYDGGAAMRCGGIATTVFLGNLFTLPPTETEFLDLPQETYAAAGDVYAAGWRVD